MKHECAELKQSVEEPKHMHADLEQSGADSKHKLAEVEQCLEETKLKRADLEQSGADSKHKLAEVEQCLEETKLKRADLKQIVADSEHKLVDLKQSGVDSKHKLADSEQSGEYLGIGFAQPPGFDPDPEGSGRDSTTCGIIQFFIRPDRSGKPARPSKYFVLRTAELAAADLERIAGGQVMRETLLLSKKTY